MRCNRLKRSGMSVVSLNDYFNKSGRSNGGNNGNNGDGSVRTGYDNHNKSLLFAEPGFNVQNGEFVNSSMNNSNHGDSNSSNGNVFTLTSAGDIESSSSSSASTVPVRGGAGSGGNGHSNSQKVKQHPESVGLLSDAPNFQYMSIEDYSNSGGSKGADSFFGYSGDRSRHPHMQMQLKMSDGPGGGGGAGMEPRVWDYMTAEVLVILFLYTVNKTGQELAVSSIPLLTRSVFGWSQEQAGYYMATMGALVLPTNILVSSLAASGSGNGGGSSIEERAMVVRLTLVCLAAVGAVCHSGLLGHYTLFQYILGTTLLFAALNSMEGVIMALLAKLISPELARGTFNSGLLATEAGTFGRVIGDIFITAFGVAQIPSTLVNKLFFPLGVLIFFSFLLVEWYYDRLT